MSSEAAKACVSAQIAKHCRKKRGRCRGAAERKRAVAIGFSICRRAGFKSIKAKAKRRK